jgi:nucleoside-diphosphate-sugar epimerase
MIAPSATLSGKRVLITGANGFIGARLAARLVREGAAVSALVSPSSRAQQLSSLRDRVTVERADIRDRAALQAMLARIRPQVVYHLASYGNHPDHYAASAGDTLVRIQETNVMGTANLLAASLDAGVECLVNTGSAHAEYGPGAQPMRESQRLAPSTYYGASKAGATLLVSAFGTAQRRNVITLRPLYVYGPGDWAFRFIPTAITACLRGDPLLLTSGGEKKNFVFVDDVVDAYRLAALAHHDGAPVVNIGARAEATLGDVIRIVERCLGKRIHYVEGAYAQLQWPSDCWAAEIDLAEQLLGWQPTTDLEAGIRHAVVWMMEREHGP